MFNNIKIVDKKRFLGIIILISISILFILVFLINNTIVASKCQYEYITIIAKNGDTLWNIAEKYNSNNEDLRKVIFNIMNFNNLDSASISFGQEIKIPIQ
jgi:4-amino-4-deoxy-L-arabinose transferase-like glycosyltransferase